MRKLIAGSAALPLLLWGAPVLAQDSGNEVWIGQTGNTNIIVIVQEGEGNRAGADRVEHLLNQDGSFNSLSVDQFGWNNSVGSLSVGEGRPSGVNQVGDFNRITVDQTNSEPAGLGSNEVRGIYQKSPFRTGTANTVTVFQSEDGASALGAGHAVGTIRQVHGTEQGAANEISVSQTGGGVGLGHSVESASQRGWANAIQIRQRDQSNAVVAAVQTGDTNFLQVEQGDGQDNLLESGEQYGFLNSIKIRQSGSRNVIQQALQNNDHLGRVGVGNRMEVVISGEDNGGDGLGGVGDFLAAATLALSGVAQGTLIQIGDDNDLGLTILQGLLTKFGVMQIGDGNGVLSSMGGGGGATAGGNEIAVFQHGDDNNILHQATGSENVVAASQVGDRNRADIQQTGDLNTADLYIDGSDTNAGGFSGAGLSLASGAALVPGLVTQNGFFQTISLSVHGSRNLFSVSQSGTAHRVESTLTGTGNQFVGVQTGNSNASLSQQSGSGNVLAVRQH